MKTASKKVATEKPATKTARSLAEIELPAKKVAKKKPEQGEGFENAVEVGKIVHGKNLFLARKIILNGKSYVDFRKFYVDEEGEPQPTKSGVMLPTDIVAKAGALLSGL